MELGGWSRLLIGVLGLTPGHIVMMLVGGTLIFLAIVRQYEPLLLLPIGFGCILANIPATGITAQGGLLYSFYYGGIATEVLPSLIFIGVGALTDFGPLLENPALVLLGAAAQFGIFGTLLMAAAMGFGIKEAAAIGVIGSADGPTSIYVASVLAPRLLGPIAVAAYSYMALVPVIQPPVMRLLTTHEERRIHMPYAARAISHATRIAFPIVVTIVCGLLVPMATPLIGMLMFGNLMRESGVVNRLSQAAQNEMANVVTILLGVAVGSTMTAGNFLHWQTILIVAMGLLAFTLDTAAGVLFGKLMCALSGRRINPLIGASGISAFPMSARVVHRMGQTEDYTNFLLMHAMASNTAGQIASVMAGGAILALLAR